MNTSNKTRLCALVAASISLVGCGKGPADPITDATIKTSADAFDAADFITKSRIQTVTVAQEGSPSKSLDIPEGVSVTVIETKVDSVHGTIARLGFDVEEGQVSEAWVAIDRTLLDSLVKESGDSPAEDALLETVRKRMTYCFRYVKRYLLSTGKVKVYLPGSSAYQAATILPRYGFRRSGHSPANAANGEVCVYAGGPQGHGHIEVKRNGKWWFGYGFNASPMQGRRFIACFVK